MNLCSLKNSEKIQSDKLYRFVSWFGIVMIIPKLVKRCRFGFCSFEKLLTQVIQNFKEIKAFIFEN